MNHRDAYRDHRIPPRSNIRGSLARHVAAKPMERLELEALARDAWLKTGTLTIFHWQRMDTWERAIVDAIGTDLYTKREK